VPLKQLTIEQLMDIDVTTAQRREEPIRLTPAAISVITGDDLRRMGITRMADALQLADGVFSARENNSTWFIGARGLDRDDGAAYSRGPGAIVDRRRFLQPKGLPRHHRAARSSNYIGSSVGRRRAESVLAEATR